MNRITSLNNDSSQDLDQTKYQLSDIYKRQNSSNEVQDLVSAFHKQLSEWLIKKNSPIPRTHKTGITYLADKKKAFLMIDIHQKLLSGRFFTGTTEIPGLEKANWVHSEDNAGCKMFRIEDRITLVKALEFAYKSYEIANSWIITNKR